MASLASSRGRLAAISAIALGTAFAAPDAHASLTLFQQYSGAYGLSTDGFGSTDQEGVIHAYVPVGATVTAAYLYSSTYSFDKTTPSAAGGTLNGSTVSYNTALGVNPAAQATCCSLQAYRADVTGIVAPVINSGAGGTYNFNVTETNSGQDGEALVVVYSLPTLATTTVALLDGFSSSSGDTSMYSSSTPLNPSSQGFQAELRIGDGFSCCGQASTITVNGQTLTTVAGNSDDGEGSNGSLITVGGNNDPFTVASPGSPASDYSTDHERYDLTPFITTGASSLNFTTVNPTNDDNIFLEALLISGNGKIISNGVPEPSTWAMMIIGFAGVGFVSMKRRKAASLRVSGACAS